MTANTNPIFTLTPSVQWGTVDDNSSATPGPILSANTAMDGTGYVTTVFTAGSNGSYLQKLTVHPVGSNTTSVLRVFLNNGSANSTQANNVLIGEITLAGTTLIQTAAFQAIELPLNFAIPPNYVLNVTLGNAIAGGVRVAVIGGNY